MKQENFFGGVWGAREESPGGLIVIHSVWGLVANSNGGIEIWRLTSRKK